MSGLGSRKQVLSEMVEKMKDNKKLQQSGCWPSYRRTLQVHFLHFLQSECDATNNWIIMRIISLETKIIILPPESLGTHTSENKCSFFCV